VAAALILIAGALGYGYWATERQVKGNPIQIAAIQGNIVQIKNWDPANARSVMQVYQDLTLEAARNSPTLIIWPETATPGSVSLHPELLRQVQALAGEVKAPILFGSTEGQKAFLGARDLHNSAFLAEPTAPSAPPAQMYHKIRLFPFGEYLPLKGVIPWSWIGVPELWSHIPGSQYFLFRIDAIRFGVTICWESLFPDHVRQFVGQGAQFIVNITNEAWFGDTAAPEQFLSMNVFRAIENGVYLIRCGNSGITCIIDPRGRVVARVSDTSGKESFVRGVLTGEILPLSPGTVYTRLGDWFPGVCGLVAAVFILAALFKRLSLRSPQAMRTDADPRMLPGLRD
jgi:apolipoprotein N-acyltransferase